jgi:hypothetical protein
MTITEAAAATVDTEDVNINKVTDKIQKETAFQDSFFLFLLHLSASTTLAPPDRFFFLA